jgi:hypothetical protein
MNLGGLVELVVGDAAVVGLLEAVCKSFQSWTLPPIALP